MFVLSDLYIFAHLGRVLPEVISPHQIYIFWSNLSYKANCLHAVVRIWLIFVKGHMFPYGWVILLRRETFLISCTNILAKICTKCWQMWNTSICFTTIQNKSLLTGHLQKHRRRYSNRKTASHNGGRNGGRGSPWQSLVLSRHFKTYALKCVKNWQAPGLI